MPDLKAAYARRGFQNVITYINSGNVIFESALGEKAVTETCETLMVEDFEMNIPVCVLPATELVASLSHAPSWWNRGGPDVRHDAFFVIPPMTPKEICARIGAIREEYEQVYYHGRIIFWSAPIATFSRTSWSRISRDKVAYCTITVRNANTTLKLAAIARGENLL
jgi:uncharacterized protein (DUF1697 family)